MPVFVRPDTDGHILNTTLTTLSAAAIPVGATMVGAGASLKWPPGPVARSHVHHTAAGAIFAAVASELVFDLIERREVWPVAIGFVLGTLAMLALRAYAEKRERANAESATGLLAALAADVLMDGFVLGIGFAAGARGGLLLTVALTLELVFLGLSITSALAKSDAAPRRVMGTTLAIAVLLPIGGVLGSLIGTIDSLVTPILAFGAAALLYLVTEELLTEAHDPENTDTPTATGAFFLAFLAILLLDIATR